MLERMSRAAMRAIDQRGRPALVALTLFAIGVIFGALAVGSLGDQDRQGLASLVAGLFGSLTEHGLPSPPGTMLAAAIGRHMRTIGLFWVLGITVVGSLGVLALVLLRGFAAGFAAGFMGAELGWRGSLLAAAALLPHNLVAVPGYVLAAAGAVNFSLALVAGGLRRDRNQFYAELGHYNSWMLICLAGLAVAAALEAYVTPWLMRLTAGIFHL